MATDETKKVMDVAKPGTSTPDIGSKPMVIGHKSMVSDPMVSQTKTEEPPAVTAPLPMQVAKITITPPDSELKPEEDTPLEQDVNTVDKVKSQEPADSESKRSEPEPNKNPDEKEAAKPAPEEVKTEEDKEGADKKSIEDKKAEEDKAATDKAIEQEEHLQKLIEEKKYFVPIKQAKNTSARTFLISFIIVAIIGVIAVVALIDSEVLDLGVKLPFDIL